MSLTQRPQINFENTYFKTIDKGSKIYIRKAKCKVNYNKVINSKYSETSSLRHWHNNNLLNEDKIFYESFKHATLSVHETRLLVFQFKRIHIIRNTNSNIYKWKTIKYPNCILYCAKRIDDIKHAFIIRSSLILTLKKIGPKIYVRPHCHLG